MTKNIGDLTFSRSELASILNCSALTINNREKAGKYPEPQRNPKNNYRFYTLKDVFNIQYIEKGIVNLAPVVAKLHDKGVTDFEAVQEQLQLVLSEFQLTLNTTQSTSQNE